MCFPRIPQHRWPGCQRELRTPGPDPGPEVDQREHRLLRWRLQPHHCVRFWDWSLLCQPAHPLPSLWRYGTAGTGEGWHSCGANACWCVGSSILETGGAGHKLLSNALYCAAQHSACRRQVFAFKWLWLSIPVENWNSTADLKPHVGLCQIAGVMYE